jgi:putative oxidoreductase
MTAYDVALLILRICLGLTLVAHGYDIFVSTGIASVGSHFHSIGMKPGEVHARLAGAVQILAGLGMALGLLTPIPAAGFVALMFVAAWTVHRPNGFYLTNGGWEYTLLLAVGAIVVAMLGSGRISLDWLLFGHSWMNGWVGLLISVVLGLGGGLGQLLIFYRPQGKTERFE